MRKLLVLDTTLRDGGRSLSIPWSIAQKIEIAQQLARLGVDVIEAGYPAFSPDETEAVRRIGSEVRGIVVCGVAQAVRAEIDRCWESLKTAENPRIHTGIATSPIHMKHKLGKTRDQVLEMAVDAVSYARRFVADVEFYAEDAFRSDREFLKRITSSVIKAGATVVNIPDTVGYATPWQYADLVSWMLEQVAEMDRVTLSVHCHNDLGMATANTLAGVRAGAGQIEGTINGIGERAGNAALEEVLMAIYAQRSEYGVTLDIDTKEVFPTSRLVSTSSGVPVPPYKAVVGANAYSNVSAIHRDASQEDPAECNVITPELIGMISGSIARR